jgi:hypothetical protein
VGGGERDVSAGGTVHTLAVAGLCRMLKSGVHDEEIQLPDKVIYLPVILTDNFVPRNHISERTLKFSNVTLCVT